MTTRPYTVIMVSNGNTLGIQGNYDYDPVRACQQIEAERSGWRVVALVPGHHMSGTSTFPRAAKVAGSHDVDVWDIPAGTTPPGKAPNCS